MRAYLNDRNDRPFTLPTTLRIFPIRYKVTAQGGPDWAEIAVNGETLAIWRILGWLRFPVEIKNRYGTKVWWGFVNGASVNTGAVNLGVTLDTMYNKIAVLWTGPDGGGITDWATDADSVSNFGEKELLLTMTGVTRIVAERRRNWELDRRRLPTPVVEKAFGSRTRATLQCLGWIHTLEWTYRERDEGVVEFLDGGASQKVGWGYTSSEVGFTEINRSVSQLFNRMNTLSTGDKVAVTGSASNDGPLTIESTSQRERETTTADTIAFLQETKRTSNEYIRASHNLARKLNNGNIRATTVVVTNDAEDTTYTETTDYDIDYLIGTITVKSDGSIANNQVLRIDYEYIEYRIEDSQLHLRVAAANDIIKISGTASNNGYKRVLSAGQDGDRLTVREGVTDEGPGNTITIERGSNAVVRETLTDELPGASITVTGYGSRIVQAFRIDSDQGWTADRVAIQARKILSPTDSLRIAIRSNSGTDPGGILESIDVPADDIDRQKSWIVAQFSNTTLLSPGVTYWISVERTGPLDSFNFYEVVVDEDLGYPGWPMKVYDGEVYQTRSPDADMPFQVLGLEETTVQITQLVSQEGQFLNGTDIVDASGLFTNQYRNGRSTSLSDLSGMLEMGTASDLRLLGSITSERTLQVRKEPVKPSKPAFMLDIRGRITNWLKTPVQTGTMNFVGHWMAIKDLPATATFSTINSPTPFLVEAAQYDVESSSYSIEPAGGSPDWRAGMSIDEG